MKINSFNLSKQEFSLIYESSRIVYEQHKIEVSDNNNKHHIEIVEEFNQFGELLYRSYKNYVFVESKAFEDDYYYDPYD